MCIFIINILWHNKNDKTTEITFFYTKYEFPEKIIKIHFIIYW